MASLSERDKRAVKLGGIGMVMIIAYVVVGPWFSNWQVTRQSLARERAKFEGIVSSGKVSAKQAGLITRVPVFEMPQGEEPQRTAFRDAFNTQLKKAGVKIKSLKSLPVKRTAIAGGYKKLMLQCRGQCGFSQVLNLLADLNSNPYFVGVEDIEMKVDSRNRNSMEVTLTVSTFVK